jgi:fibronectin-binding autotransporter adhesin
MIKKNMLRLVFALTLGLLQAEAFAADLYWSGNGSTQGGAGTWNTTSNRWGTVAGGPYSTAWNNGNNDTAIFGNTAGTVTLGEGITVGGLTFSAATYTVTANTLTFGTAGIISNSVAATIASALAGTGAITKNGVGTLTLSGVNTFSGGIVLNAGTLSIDGFDVNLGAATGGITANGTATFTFAQNNNTTLSALRTITVNEGAVFTIDGKSGAGNVRTYQGALIGNGAIIIPGSSVGWFTSFANTFTGTITVPGTINMASLGDSSNPINLPGTFSWTGGAKTFALRPFILSAAGNGSINNNGTGALVIQQPLAITGAAGSRTLTLGGSLAGISTFAGSITNGTGSTVNLSKVADGSMWALSGTNTYTGATTLPVVTTTAAASGAFIFQGIQALPTSTTLSATSSASNGGKVPGTFKILDDSVGTISRSGVNLSWTGANGQDPFTVFVGNNNTANGGNSAGTTTGSTIQLGNMSFSETSGSTAGLKLDVTGANGYRLELNTVNITLQAAQSGNLNIMLNPTTAPLTVTGNVQQQSGAASGNVNLQLDGTATNNLIAGNILNSADGTPRALTLTKQNTSTWTLSGANTYTGPTLITGGKLIVNGSLAAASVVTNSAGLLGGTGTVNGAVTLSGTGGLDLRDGIVGTLTVNNNFAITGVTAGANPLYFELGAGASSADKLMVTGNVTMATSGAGVITLNLLSGAALTPGTIDLIEVTGTIPAASSFTLATTAAAGSTFSLQLDGTSKKLQLVIAGGSAGPAAPAWTGGSSANWNTGGNWTGASVPGYSSDVTFYNTGAANLTTVLDADFEINSLLFNAGAIANVTVGGTKMLTLGAASGTGISLATPSSGTPSHTISRPVGLAASQTWTVNSGVALTVSGAISDFGLARSLTKAGTGTLSLSGANTFTGGLTINAGTLAPATATSTLNYPVTFTGDSKLSFTANGGTLTFAQPVVINSSVTSEFDKGSGGAGGTFTFNGTLSGSGTLSFISGGSGLGTYNLNNAGAFTGTVQIGANTSTATPLTISASALGDGGKIRHTGTGADLNFTYTGGAMTFDNRQVEMASTKGIIINNNGFGPIVFSQPLSVSATGAKTLTLSGANPNDNTFAGAITNGSSAVISLTKSGNGTWILSGANTYSGGTTLSAGTLVANSSGALGASNVTVTAGTLVIQTADVIADTATLRLPNLSAVNLIMNANDTVAVLFVGGVQQPNGTYTSTGMGAGWMTGSGTLTVGSAATLPKYWDLNGTTAGTGSATPTGTWDAINTYWNATADGTGSTVAWTSGATAAFAAGTDATGTYTVTVSGTPAIGGLTFEEGNVTLTGGTALQLVSDAAAYVATNRTAVVETPLTQDATTRSLIKSGTGTLVLSGANTYVGGTTLSQGTLSLGGTSALSTGTVTIAGGALDSTVADLVNTANNPQSWSGDFSFIGSQNLNLGTGPVTLGAARTVTVNAKTLTVGGAIGGAFALTKVGAGTLALTGTNTYTGGTTVNAGTLLLDGGVLTNTSYLRFGASVASVVLTNGARVIAGAADQFNANQATLSDGSMTVVGGTGRSIFNCGAGTLYVGSARTATVSNNRLLVGMGGVVTNVSNFWVGDGGAYTGGNSFSNQFVVTDGGQLHVNSSLRIGVLVNGGNDNCNATYNSGTIANGGVVRVGTEVGVGALDPSRSNGNGSYSFNRLTITNGAQLYSGGTRSYIGWVVSTYANGKANNNSVTIAGSLNGTNAMWNLGGKPLAVGYTTISSATNNVLAVSASGVATNISSLTVYTNNTLSLGAGGLVYANTVTNLGTMAVGIDNAVAPGCGRLIVSGELNVNNTTLSITTNSLPTNPVYVIASYNTLTGAFSATNGLPDKFIVDMNYKGLKQIALVGAPAGTLIQFR